MFTLGPGGYRIVAQLTFCRSCDQYPGPTLAADGSLLSTDGVSNYDVGGNLVHIKDGKVIGDVVFASGGPASPSSGQPIVSSTGSVIGTTFNAGLCSEYGAIYEVTL